MTAPSHTPVYWPAVPFVLDDRPPDVLRKALEAAAPAIPAVLMDARVLVPYSKRQIEPFQAAFLSYLAQRVAQRVPNGRFLEIGTAQGYSAAILALSCPGATITTLNPKDHEVEQARDNLRSLPQVTVLQQCSWDFLAGGEAHPDGYDLIFVDGDHNRIRRDLPWFEHLRPGGIFIHHDYAPEDSARPCPPVYAALNAMRTALGRPFDLLCVDNRRVGMAGFVRRAEDAGSAWQERIGDA